MWEVWYSLIIYGPLIGVTLLNRWIVGCITMLASKASEIILGIPPWRAAWELTLVWDHAFLPTDHRLTFSVLLLCVNQGNTLGKPRLNSPWACFFLMRTETKGSSKDMLINTLNVYINVLDSCMLEIGIL